ncbi:MAG: helix-turn-helix transcriptional regulator [Clostridia bacterium]|nr:helix-turn-helix transcriptional regulator [Clostridia bacterium]
MDKLEKLGERINRYRTERGLSQLELSELLEVSRQSISKWETDVAVPELSKLVRMAEIFGISLDTLVLGKESDKAEEKPIEAPAPVDVKKPYSPIKAGMGFMFLGVGILLSVLLLILTGDLFAALVLFLPFALSAFFCLGQYQNAALWCSASFFFVIAWYLYILTGSSWTGLLNPLIYTDAVSPWFAVISWALFAALAFLICMTVFVYRGHKFEYSKRKRITLAVVTLAIYPIKTICGSFYSMYFLAMLDQNPIFKYRLLIQTADYLIKLAVLFTFTACLVPTFYWLRGMMRKRKEDK